MPLTLAMDRLPENRRLATSSPGRCASQNFVASPYPKSQQLCCLQCTFVPLESTGVCQGTNTQPCHPTHFLEGLEIHRPLRRLEDTALLTCNSSSSSLNHHELLLHIHSTSRRDHEERCHQSRTSLPPGDHEQSHEQNLPQSNHSRKDSRLRSRHLHQHSNLHSQPGPLRNRHRLQRRLLQQRAAALRATESRTRGRGP